MPSFDISSKLDAQSIDNAINVTRKEFTNRWDFKGSKSQIEFDKKAMNIRIATETELRMEAICDMLHSRMLKQGLDPRGLDESKPHQPSGTLLIKTIGIKQGLDAENAKRLLQCIKALNLKVTAQHMNDCIRVTHKQIDTLQKVMQACKQSACNQPLQFINLKS